MNTIPKNRIDRLVPMAIKKIEEFGIARQEERNGKAAAPGVDSKLVVPKPYHGYISSFGASMVQSSPLAAAIFFEDNSGSQEDRSKLPRAILSLICWENDKDALDKKLSDYIMEKMVGGHIPNSVTRDILAASIALKIALRTFKISETNGK
jgi:CRISPR-associated protein Cmr5